MTLSRRGLLSAAGASGLMAGLAACGSDSSGAASGEGGAVEGGELSILTPIFEGADGKEVLEGTIGDALVGKVPGTTLAVDYVPWDRLNEKLSTGIAGGQVTDVIMAGVGWTPPFAQKGVLAELPESILDGLGVHEALLDTCRYDGALYALPYQMDARMIVGNKAMMEERGISEVPTSLEDFREMLKEFQGGDLATPFDLFTKNIRQAWIQIMAGYGGSLFTEDGSAVAFDDGTGEAALQYIIDLIADGSTDFHVRQAEGQPRPFQQDQVAFMWLGSAEWPEISQQNPELVSEDAMEIFHFPSTEGLDPVMFLGGTLVSLSTRARDPELAQEFLRTLYEPELLTAASNHGGRVPAVADLPEDESLSSNRFTSFALENLQYAGAAEGGSPIWMEIREILTPQIEAAVTGSQTPSETIAKLKTEAEAALDRL